MSHSILELKNISIRAGGRLCFRHTLWAMHRNQNWLMIGGNGSGKTLLSRAIAGEVPVVTGEISYNFRPPAGKLPEDCITLVSFEQQKAAAGEGLAAERWFSAEPSISVHRFLSQELVEEINPFEVRPRREQIPSAFRRHRRRILDLLQLRPLLKRRIPSLSNGEMRKVLMARALLRKPKLLILDDAFAGLDPQYRAHLTVVLENLMKNRQTQVMLTDSLLQSVPRGITHILLLRDCRVFAQGAFRRMRKNPHVRRLMPASRFFPQSTFPAKNLPADEAEKLVQMEDVSIRYDGSAILSKVNWTIRRGESWAVSGPNGSGKTTLLSVINGDNPQAYSNRVFLFGRLRGTGESIWAVRKKIGSVSPELHLHFPDDQSCLETVVSGFFETNGLFDRLSAEKRAAALRMLQLFCLSSAAHKPFHSVSMGVQRMVLLARALVKSPDLLLLDEPCQGLDAQNRARFLRIVRTLLRQRKTTVVYVTHRREEIPREIERMLVLKDGRAAESGMFPREIRTSLSRRADPGAKRS
jgi:molybdate transport system ATP-binding protein